jgi:organic radical activating enzyme
MTFVRFTGCNLACNFCDTPYDRVALNMTEDELIHNILRRDQPWVKFTGGEPTLQLCERITQPLKAVDKAPKLCIETNGMVWTEAFHDLDYITVSPIRFYDDPANPIPVEKMVAPKLLDAVIKTQERNEYKHPIDELRFVITGTDDDIIEHHPLIPYAKWLILSPAFQDPEPMPNWKSGMGHPSMKGVVDQRAFNHCMRLIQKHRHRNVRLSLQTHKFVGVR